MDLIEQPKEGGGYSFISHVLSTTDEGKAELLNVTQYSLMGIIPIVALNKMIQRFIPEADGDKSSLEILVEIMIQVIVMFCGIVIIHRIITYFPTYSGFKYDSLILTNVVLAFLVIVLSVQTKLGLKVNILVDRLSDLWEGNDSGAESKDGVRRRVRVSQPMSSHVPSQADHLDGPVQTTMFPPAPVATSKPQTNTGYDYMLKGTGAPSAMDFGPMAANSVLGSKF